VYGRESALAMLAGTHIAGATTPAIDGQGAIFYQSSRCAGHGSAELIDPDFNRRGS
jgi:hypothetical protein